MNQKYCELSSALKITKLLLNDRLISGAFKSISEKLQIQNAVLLYQLTSKFKITCPNITALRYIERCFSNIVETKSF